MTEYCWSFLRILRPSYAGGNPVLSLDLSFLFPVRLSAQQLAVY